MGVHFIPHHTVYQEHYSSATTVLASSSTGIDGLVQYTHIWYKNLKSISRQRDKEELNPDLDRLVVPNLFVLLPRS